MHFPLFCPYEPKQGKFFYLFTVLKGDNYPDVQTLMRTVTIHTHAGFYRHTSYDSHYFGGRLNSNELLLQFCKTQ